MSQIDLIDNRWSDIMFENRNKEYGAYVLRRQTTARNIKSIIAVLIIFALVMVYMVAKNAYDDYQAKHQAQTQVTELTALQEQKKEAKVERKEIVKQEKVEQVVEKVKSSIKFTAPVIKKDNEVKDDEEIDLQKVENTNTTIGAFDVQGNDEVGGEVLKAKEEIAQPEPPKHEEENKVFDVVEQMPSFPGGMPALMQWLSQNIKYPVIAAENGVQGRVIVQFVVEKDGSVTDVHVAKSVDPSLDKEATRVVKAMPRWNPGKQNGSAVRVKYTVPVMFKLQ